MTRVFNFSAGPAALPESVLRQAADEMLDWHGSGMSVMEMSHRGKEFIAIHAEARKTCCASCWPSPSNYKVLFMQGGAIAENAIVPMNLLRGQYRRRLHRHRRLVEEVDQGGGQVLHRQRGGQREGHRLHDDIPARETWKLDPNAAYVHICANETIGGVEYHFTPDSGEVPLVADVSSNILSRPLDVSKYGLIYGGAQKNIGPAGLTIVIVRDDLLGRALPITPSAFDYGSSRPRPSRC